jgi:hypothetical protein
LTAVSVEFAKPPDISEDFPLQFSVLGMRPRLEDLEAIIQSEDLINGCASTCDVVLLSDIPVDFRIRSHFIKPGFSSTSIRRPSGTIGDTSKLTASTLINPAVC